MSNAVLITREPVINKQYKITANRLIVHAATVARAVEGLQGLADVWPATHPVFISLYRLVPTPDLLKWTAPANAMIEITIATASANGLGVDLVGSSYRVGIPGRFSAPPAEEGLAFGFIAVCDTSIRFPGIVVDPAIGTSWPGDRDLLVVARLWLNGDPANTEVHFTVADLWVMHWDLQRVPLTHLALKDFAPSSPVTFNEQRTLMHEVTLPAPASEQTWLYFHWLRYLPLSQNNAARFEITMQPDGGAEQ